MDILGHAMYGATMCSRTGFAGGRQADTRKRFDWTIWAAVAFSVFPDLASIGVVFGRMILVGHPPSFHEIPPYVFVLYRTTHSLIVAGIVSAMLFMGIRALAVPSLAWPVHLLMDSVLHDDGRWQTPLLYPLSDWHVRGINWWEHGWVVAVYWGLLPLLWCAIRVWRRNSQSCSCAPSSTTRVGGNP